MEKKFMFKENGCFFIVSLTIEEASAFTIQDDPSIYVWCEAATNKCAQLGFKYRFYPEHEIKGLQIIY